jgi:hypothetical protein
MGEYTSLSEPFAVEEVLCLGCGVLPVKAGEDGVGEPRGYLNTILKPIRSFRP